MSRQILPCWAAHSRMGHNVLYGYAEPYAGTSIVLTVPAIEGDDQHSGTDEEVHVLPMEGPAFYGFEVLTEDGVRARLASKRPWKPRAFLPAPAEGDAVEVPAEECQALADDMDAAERDKWRDGGNLAEPTIGTLLRNFTVEELEALPEGSTFFGADEGGGEDTWTRMGSIWMSSAAFDDRSSADLVRVWGEYSYRLTRIGPAPIVQAAPISSDVRPAAAVGQRVFVSRLDRLTETAERARTSGWYLVTEVATTAGVLGAPIVVERLTGLSGDLAVPTVRYVLTLTEWEQNVSTVLDSNGVTLFDEVPF